MEHAPLAEDPCQPIDLPETVIDLQAIADDIERGILASIEEQSPPRMRSAPAPRPSPLPSRMRIAAFSAVVATGIAALLASRMTVERSQADASPIPVVERIPSPPCEPDRILECVMHEGNVVSVVLHGERPQMIDPNQAVPFSDAEGKTIAQVGKLTHDHEWIFFGTWNEQPIGVFLAPEEGVYINALLEHARRCSRRELLTDPGVSRFLRDMPRIATGGKTPLSWGRDTSYGGQRGVERVRRMIEQLRGESLER